MKPLCIDLFCGLGGFSEGILSEGFECVGFDIERHAYGDHKYPAQLVLQNVLTIHGRQFKDAALIVASPPCQEYSWMAMPWSRAKQVARALRGQDEFPAGYTGSRTVADLTALFDACFRIQREACDAADRHIPLIVENVRGAIPWVGRSRWNFGSFHLFGDVPALMPMARGIGFKSSGLNWSDQTKRGQDFTRVAGNQIMGSKGIPYRPTGHWTNAAENDCKQPGDWFSDATPGSLCSHSSKSNSRKFASAMIAKIPFQLSRHIGRVFHPGAA